MVCGGCAAPYFTKDFAGRCGLNVVQYWRCAFCGLTVSKTHLEMQTGRWEEMNRVFHSSYQGKDEAREDPRWLSRLRAQCENFKHLATEGVLPRHTPWIDYGCGDGKLADMLSRCGLRTLKYDKYMDVLASDYVGESALDRRYAVVVNTSVFEHVRSVEELDEIAGLADSPGVLALHTLVCEEIPRDPEWFYLIPPHTVFFTNRSMQILFERWGFEACLYHVPSRMWFAFREEATAVAEFAARQRSRGSNDFRYKREFVDFWKREPRRSAA
jgi:hypothetical protein